MKSPSIGGIVVLLLACGAPAKRADSSAAGISVQGSAVITENACQGESCQASYPAVACRDLKLVASPTDTTSPSALKRGDTVDVRTDLHLKKPGIVVLKRDVSVPDEWNTGTKIPPPLRFKAGDTLLLLSYVGEGFWKASYRGRQMEVLEFWAGPGQREYGSQDSAQALDAIGTSPVIETWLRVSRGGRVMGWWLDDETSPLIPIGEYGEKWGLRCE